MSKRYIEYRQLLLESLAAQRRGDTATEDAILAHLDHLWLTMNPAERKMTDELGRLLSRESVVTVCVTSDRESELRLTPIDARRGVHERDLSDNLYVVEGPTNISGDKYARARGAHFVVPPLPSWSSSLALA